MTFFRSGVNAWQRWSGQALEDRDQARDRRERALLLLVTVFIFVNAIAYSLVTDDAVRWSHLFAPIVWLVVVGTAHLTLQTWRPRRDPFLLPVVALLSGWGLLLQDNLAPNFLGRQTLWFALATMAMLVVAILPRTYAPLMRYRYSLLTGGLLLLAFTLIFGVNPSGSGAALWLPAPFPFLGTVYFQPSELLKVLLVVFLASYFTELEPLYHYRKQANDKVKGKSKTGNAFRQHLPFLGPLLLMWGFTLLLLVWQRDLGAAALFFIVFVAMLYLATGEKAYTLSGLTLLLLAGVIAFYAFDTVVAPRVLSWLNPWPNVSDRAYQIVQALYAQAAGGILGQGIGQGSPDYIPVVHSDFALAAIAEEWGLIGSLTVVGCFVVLAVRGLRIAILSIRNPRPQFFHAYLAAGLVALFSVQALLIMGGVTRLLPLTGITLPFVSYGGSSLLVSNLAIGMLFFISAQAESASATPTADPGLARRIDRLGRVILICFAIVAGALTYWSTLRSDSLLARADNPRLVENERNIQRGLIMDRDDVILAETVVTANRRERRYPLPDSGPAVGYYSIRYGSAGVESAFNDHLSGRDNNLWVNALRRLLHEPVIGRDIGLTLDAGLQQMAAHAMATTGITGGMVLLEHVSISGDPVAEIRAMVSQPGYDPNLIDAEFEELSVIEPGPLVNRATQGLYQPGLVLQPFITAAAMETDKLEPATPLDDPFRPVAINGQVIRCMLPRDESAEAPLTWADMGRLRCPAPLKALGEQLGAPALQAILEGFGFGQTPEMPVTMVTQAVRIQDVGLAAIGQDVLTITPLQAARATAALIGDGRLPGLRLVERLQGSDKSWATQPPGAPASSTSLISRGTAAIIREGWETDEGALAFSALVLARPDGGRNAWFLGMAPADNPRFVLALVLEDVDDTEAAEELGREILLGATASQGE
ncbi:MAG TPA: FtsW/RodA/SpoVE family cell cycle protein [Promineifilum sp.]|nr:FtsW/RodA/SpoVE family cell cycle protein [Promineifilum sp.]HRQ12469.1 FtsW/RodA/SpoVE family cell cycle protein [Promineifilum sp.]